MAASYRLPDEPRPGPLARFVVNPIWPLFAVMFAGPWLSWSWFVFNAWALGSPTRVRETLYAVVGLVGGAAIFAGIVAARSALALPDQAIAYLAIMLTVWKLGVSYLLSELQGRGFGVYEWYGGVVRNGMFVVFGGALLRPTVADAVGPLASLVLL